MIEPSRPSEVQPDRDGTGGAPEALGSAERDGGGSQGPQGLWAAFQDRGSLQEVENAEARREPGRTGRRKDVVGSAHVISDRFRRVAAQKDRPGVADLEREFVRVLGCDLQV